MVENCRRAWSSNNKTPNDKKTSFGPHVCKLNLTCGTHTRCEAQSGLESRVSHNINLSNRGSKLPPRVGVLITSFLGTNYSDATMILHSGRIRQVLFRPHAQRTNGKYNVEHGTVLPRTGKGKRKRDEPLYVELR